MERFENEDFLAEDHREEEQARLDALKPPKKGPGRPKKYLGDDTSREVSVTPGPTNAVKRPPGRPRKFAVVIPAFNGPKPSQERPITVQESPKRASSESSEAEFEPELPSRIPAYSMMQASGLEPIEECHDEATSREVTTSGDQSLDELGPSPKRRKVSSGLLYMDTTSPLAQPEQTLKGKSLPQQERAMPPSQSRSPKLPSYEVDETKGGKSRSENEIEDVDVIATYNAEAEREALLQRFLPNSTRDSSAVSDSSSDSLVGAASTPPRNLHAHPSRPARTSPPEATHSHPSRPAQRTPPIGVEFTTPTTVIPARPTSKPHQDHHLVPTSDSPINAVSPNKSKPRRLSMTPNFPHGSRPNSSKRLEGAIDSRLPSSSSSLAISEVRTKPDISPPPQHNKRKASVESESNISGKAATNNAPPISQSRRLGPQRISSPKDITAYFAPRSTPKQLPVAPILAAKTANKSTSSSPKRPPNKNLLPWPQTDDEIESDDPLSLSLTLKRASSSPKQGVREVRNSISQASQSPSSSDSRSSQVLVVRRAEARDWLEDGSDDEVQPQIKDAENEEQDEVSLVGSTPNSGHGEARQKSQTAARNVPIPIVPQLRGGNYVGDDEDDETESSTESDSMSSEILVVRRG